MCLIDSYFWGLDLKYGCYFLALWNITFGILYAGYTAKIMFQSAVSMADQVLGCILIMTGLFSVSGGIFLLIGTFLRKALPLRLGLILGFPVAIITFLLILPLLIQVYHAIVVCTFVSVNLNGDLETNDE